VEGELMGWDDRMTMVAWLLWLHGRGLIGDSLSDGLVVMTAPKSWEAEWREFCAEIEASEGAAEHARVS
jgi:hypothetical protein